MVEVWVMVKIYTGIHHKKVWTMSYERGMGYTVPFPANQVGQRENVWDMRDYVWIEVWVTGASTVLSSYYCGYKYI